jgi:hypothetical protein
MDRKLVDRQIRCTKKLDDYEKKYYIANHCVTILSALGVPAKLT